MMILFNRIYNKINYGKFIHNQSYISLENKHNKLLTQNKILENKHNKLLTQNKILENKHNKLLTQNKILENKHNNLNNIIKQKK
jgi:hypothetical protein